MNHLSLILLILLSVDRQPVQERTAGRVLEPEAIASQHLGGNRTIQVYLPPSYHRNPQQRYPVLYVHDGQNVFSTAGPDVAFGWGSWEIDLTIDRMVDEGKMREIIVVAVANTRQRMQEYRGPARPWSEEELSRMQRQPAAPGDNSRYESYRRFLVEELKPWIDQSYRTLTEPAHTGLLGSSLGGICSLALAWDRPDVFGLAASLSGSFQIEQSYFLEEMLKPYQDHPKSIRIYLDSGSISLGGGNDGATLTAAVADELRRIGWQEDHNLHNFLDAEPLSPAELEPLQLSDQKCAEAQRSQHNELYWRLRVWRPLIFLFPVEPPPLSTY
ncbi:alpha/beta hydrolase [Candidatus Zixiibacteriota bacterium]